MISKEDLMELGLGSYAEPQLLTSGPYAGHWAHLAQMLFTVGLMITDSSSGHPTVRWCYYTRREAKAALETWNGEGNPPGDWIVMKPGDVRRVKGD